MTLLGTKFSNWSYLSFGLSRNSLDLYKAFENMTYSFYYLLVLPVNHKQMVPGVIRLSTT
jgi:hypothetical protein